ncbi:carboxymuconolactone decarboxylase family protein [Priestia filamentosa]|uniref:carboxymuconolactone decarboxylase family protein n=1 Tax=Priestia filamentosa TaxID=1402861 RepID=UPI001FB5044A|nr:carboxymuconolactone decarboxylase family protein [Priestia filamentosa]MED3729022.1 carboxymuconolactone decarboxylase family protein [Priestia filamentosa]UOE58799.1 carboxymuconolactone decarboxylase family protein [Priestia filamentosa]
MNRGDFSKGFEAREEVLGRENVEAFIEHTNDFNKPFHELAMNYCWGEIWNRPGLSKKTRSLLNIGILTALNYQNELRIHLKGALRNGCTKEEIQEVLLQCTIYCGVPAAGSSFETAMNLFHELEEEMEK